MDAKLWAEEYNRHNPPKKVWFGFILFFTKMVAKIFCYLHVLQVDIFSMGVIELVERAQAPLFHIEHYIDGEYIKYNSNSGFVEDRQGPERMTPQVFVFLFKFVFDDTQGALPLHL